MQVHVRHVRHAQAICRPLLPAVLLRKPTTIRINQTLVTESESVLL